MASLYPLRMDSTDDDQRLLLGDVSWNAYEAFRDAITSANVQMVYLDGRLEIVTKGKTHEVSKTMIARLFELFCFVREIPLYAYGEMTMKRRARKRGLEPDEWYSRGPAGKVPALALEVIVSRGAIDKLEVYAGLGVREVWLYEAGQFTIVVLRGKRYRVAAASQQFPEAPLDRIAAHAQNPDQPAALKAFHAELVRRRSRSR